MSKSSTDPDAAAEAALPANEVGPIPPLPEGNGRSVTGANLEKFITRYWPQRKRADPQLQIVSRAIFNQNPDYPELNPNSVATQLADAAVLWALLTGRRRAVLLAGDRGPAVQFIRGLTHSLATNELLLQDWPEVCIPVRHALQMGNGGKGQTYRGVETLIEISDERLRFARIAQGRAPGAMGHADGAFVCTQFHQPQYDLRLTSLPPTASDAA